MSEDEMRDELRAACKAEGSQRAFAARLGVSPAYVSAVLGGVRPPSRVVLDALGLERVVETRVSYRRRK